MLASTRQKGASIRIPRWTTAAVVLAYLALVIRGSTAFLVVDFCRLRAGHQPSSQSHQSHCLCLRLPISGSSCLLAIHNRRLTHWTTGLQCLKSSSSSSARGSKDAEEASLAEEAAELAEMGRVFPAKSRTGAAVATFAGGCFWGAELRFQREEGVLATIVGYTQGTQGNPTYKAVCDEQTGHTEAVLLTYDPALVSYQRLCEIVFNDIIGDPTLLNRVGNDRGTQYRTGLYAHSEVQLVEAQRAFDREAATWRSSGRTVVTEVKHAAVFWPAEEPHQSFLAKGGQSAEKGASDPIRCYG